MTRKLCMLLAMALAVTGALFVPDASAQGEPTCRISFVEEPADGTPPPIATVAPRVDTDTDSATAEPADAQSANVIAKHSCADAEAYPGPFTNMPVTPTSPYSAPIGLTASAPVTPPAAAASPSAGLAHSGSEVFVLAYLGTGLLAFGAVALGIRRGTRVE